MSTERITHLYRGAPSVRQWSMHQITDTRWTLCGIYQEPGDPMRERAEATEDENGVTCWACLELIRRAPATYLAQYLIHFEDRIPPELIGLSPKGIQ